MFFTCFTLKLGANSLGHSYLHCRATIALRGAKFPDRPRKSPLKFDISRLFRESRRVTTYRILAADGVSPKGIAVLAESPHFQVETSGGLKEDELIARIGELDALIIRSATKVTPKALAAAKRLKVIGRAGVGVDNVNVEAATERGIVVMNTPGGNTISTAEHTFSLLLSLARKIPQAHASMVAG